MGNDRDQSRLDELDAQIEAARAAQRRKQESNAFAGRAMGAGFRVATELVACTLVGALLGWWLDGLLGSKPWLMIGLLLLGAGAGLRNAWRVSQQAGEALAKDLPAAPAVGFDDEDDDWGVGSVPARDKDKS